MTTLLWPGNIRRGHCSCISRSEVGTNNSQSPIPERFKLYPDADDNGDRGISGVGAETSDGVV